MIQALRRKINTDCVKDQGGNNGFRSTYHLDHLRDLRAQISKLQVSTNIAMVIFGKSKPNIALVEVGKDGGGGGGHNRSHTRTCAFLPNFSEM